MALAATIEVNDGTLTPTGIAIAFLPISDPSLPMELWRAPDLAGAPDAANAVMVCAQVLPPAGINYVDRLPTDGAVWWYRSRSNGNAYGPGAYTDWVNMGAADRLTVDYAQLLAMQPVEAIIAPYARIAGQTRTVAQVITWLLTNAEFDVWDNSGQPHAWTVDTGDASVCAKDTTVVFSGDAAAKFSFGGGGSSGTYRGLATNDPTKGGYCVPLRPGQSYRLTLSVRASSIAGASRYKARFSYNLADSLNESYDFAFAAANTWATREIIFTVPGTAEANSKFWVEFTRGNTTGQDFWVDSLRLEENGVVAVSVGQATTASIQDVAILREKIGSTLVDDIAHTTSRSRFFNGGFEDQRNYWNSNPGGFGNTTLTINNDADTYIGTYSAKLTHVGAAVEYFYQATEPRNIATPPANWVKFAVRPLRRIQVDYSCKVSGANVIGRVYIAEYSASGGFLSETQIGTDVTSTTWVDRSEEFTVGSTTFFVVPRFKSEGTSSGSVWYDELYFTDLIPLNDTTGGWFDNGTKTAGFTLDFQKGATQFVEINGTALAITFSNLEEGGVYVVYLKQNSSPDTVTWPASVHWKQATGVFVPSATTGRIDRVSFQRINGVDYAGFENYWT